MASCNDVNRSFTDVDRANVAGHLVVTDVCRVAVAELAVLAVAPAQDLAAFQQRARVVTARDHLHRQPAEIDRVHVGRQLVVANISGIAVAQPAQRTGGSTEESTARLRNFGFLG